MNKPKAQHKKKNDSEVANKLAEKKHKRREKKHNLKLIKRKSKRTGRAVFGTSDDSE